MLAKKQSKLAQRWDGIVRPYSTRDVKKLRGSITLQYTLAKMGAEKFWRLLHQHAYVPALGAMTGLQAVQMMQAGLKAVYVSGWQVAADANLACQTYPDQSLYPGDSVPSLVRRINNAFIRADQIQHYTTHSVKGHNVKVPNVKGRDSIDWFAPLVADGEAGFGGNLNVFELMKAMIEAGASAVHFEDQLASVKKCGHMGGKVLIPTAEFIHKLVAARLAADVLGVPTILIARTDAHSANLLTSDSDAHDRQFLTGARSPEGFYYIRQGIESAIVRGLSYAPYADMLWFETSSPSLAEATAFAKAIHQKFPGKLLAYNCSPSFHWKKKLDTKAIASFQKELGKLGYKFQFVTLAGFHALNLSMFALARGYKHDAMSAYVELQQAEFAAKEQGYKATEHQAFVGTGYFDHVAQVISGGKASTLALHGSTEREQF